ncbi:MAG: hypothetical protein K0B37_10395 [Bacteroidales bacterium]|nr:hypothetical protein [Bacteroidales bacterium]
MVLKTLTILSFFVVAVLVSGCAVTDNPREGGFISGMNALSTGKYEERLQQRELLYKEESQNKQGLEQQAVALNDQAQLEKSKLAAEQQQMSKLRLDLAAMEVKLNKVRQKSSHQKKEISVAKDRIEAIRKEMESQESSILLIDDDNSTSIQSDHLKALQTERERLIKEYSALLEYTQALANVPD